MDNMDKKPENLYYEMEIAGLTRRLPLCPLNDDLYIAGFIMFNDAPLTVKVADELLARAPEFDIIVTAESKGIPLAYELARRTGKGYIVLRKEKKLYMADVVRTDVDSITTDHIQTLCIDIADAKYITGQRVLIVDDVISTGESLKSMEAIINQIGGNIVGKMAVLAEGSAADRDDIIFLEKLPLFNPDGTVKE